VLIVVKEIKNEERR